MYDSFPGSAEKSICFDYGATKLEVQFFVIMTEKGS